MNEMSSAAGSDTNTKNSEHHGLVHSCGWEYVKDSAFCGADSDDDSEDETYLLNDTRNGCAATIKANKFKSKVRSEHKTERVAALSDLERDISSLRRDLQAPEIPCLNIPPPYNTENIALTHKHFGTKVSDLAKGQHVGDWKPWERTFVPLIRQFPDNCEKGYIGNHNEDNNETNRKKLQFILNACGCSLFLLFDDPSEQCRSLAIRCIRHLSLSSLDMGKHISYLMPAIFSRYPDVKYDEEEKVFVHDEAKHDFYKRGGAINRLDREQVIEGGSRHIKCTEPSEEIRCELCDLISCLIRSFLHTDNLSLLDAYFSDIILSLHSHLCDPYPTVKISAAKLLVQILRLPRWEIGAKYYATAIARASLPLLRHRNSRVRLESISLLEASVSVPDREKLKGAGSEVLIELTGFREENVLPISAFYKHECSITVNILAELVVDKNINVRSRCCEMLSFFICCLPDRYTHQQRLLPYILSFYNDDQSHIQQQAMAAVENCGQQYEVENPNDIIERRQFGIDGDARCNHMGSLPPPFDQRPRIGSRLFVRNNTKRFFAALLVELQNWIPRTRLQSAKLLHILVIYCEEHLTMDFRDTLFGVVKALQLCHREDDKDAKHLRQVLEEILQFMGRYVDPGTYVRLLLPRISNDVKSSTTFSEGALHSKLSCVVNTTALRCMIQGSLPRRVVVHYVTILKALSSPTTLGQYADRDQRLESLSTLTSLFRSVEEFPVSGLSTIIFEETGKLWNTCEITESFAQVLNDVLRYSGEDQVTIDAIKNLQQHVASVLETNSSQ